ncbi:hypothetical protein [Coleofasciculus sp. FACHB-SPT36]|uniref:hypothetical protein n=1 Tax=Cyanophyceae TaxID=3028117 RepID=UPI001F55627B|nr:hypothetical protein [Coleofasciculus sp. FACHB-SPT36]
MNFLRGRLQRLTAQLPDLIDQLADDNLDDAWKVLQQIYYDLYMLKPSKSRSIPYSRGKP